MHYLNHKSHIDPYISNHYVLHCHHLNIFGLHQLDYETLLYCRYEKAKFQNDESMIELVDLVEEDDDGDIEIVRNLLQY